MKKQRKLYTKEEKEKICNQFQGEVFNSVKCLKCPFVFVSPERGGFIDCHELELMEKEIKNYYNEEV